MSAIDSIVDPLTVDRSVEASVFSVGVVSGECLDWEVNVWDCVSVASLDTLETLESFDLASDRDLDIRFELLESDRSGAWSPSFTDTGVPDLLLLESDRSVSGGLGGRSSFSFRDSFRREEDFRGAERESTDFDRLLSLLPRSVPSGVSGSVRVEEISSLLYMRSLLWTLLKVGYGMFGRSMLRASSGTISVMELVAPDRIEDSSLSISFGRWRR